MFALLKISPEDARSRIIVLESGLEWAGGPPALRTVAVKGLRTLGSLWRQRDLRDDQTTHVNVTAVLEMVKPAFPELGSGKGSVLDMLSFYHNYGAVKLLHFPFICGVSVAIMPRFDPDWFCATLSAVDTYDVSSLEPSLSGVAPLGADLVKQVTKRLHACRNGKGDFCVLQGYGLTETSPATYLLPTPDALCKVGNIGVLLPNLEVRLLVDGDGARDVEAPIGQPGELWIRGLMVMKVHLLLIHSFPREGRWVLIWEGRRDT
ncbi:hypothetical protein DXG01_004936 [Tephrocybe rancida]|nr:hypothetical protein DXG01_004936 [Tephrocybe rancida]